MSGLHLPPRLLLDVVVADRRGGASASSICCVGDRARGRHAGLGSTVVDASPTHIPAKQSACSSIRTRVRLGPVRLRSRPSISAGDVLDVVAVLVRRDVELGERPAARAELALQLRRRSRGRGRSSGRAGSRTGRWRCVAPPHAVADGALEADDLGPGELAPGRGQRLGPVGVERVDGRAEAARRGRCSPARGALADRALLGRAAGAAGHPVDDRAEVDAEEQRGDEHDDRADAAAHGAAATAATAPLRADAAAAEPAAFGNVMRPTLAARPDPRPAERPLGSPPRHRSRARPGPPRSPGPGPPSAPPPARAAPAGCARGRGPGRRRATRGRSPAGPGTDRSMSATASETTSGRTPT